MLPVLLFAFQASAAVGTVNAPVRSLGRAPIVVPAVAGPREALAVRAPKPPVLDGRDTDDVWRDAQLINAFRQFDPVEDGEPPLNTEARVTFDDRFLYVFVRAFDPHPDSVRAFLSRRDSWTASDRIWVMIDSYHDRRTGYEFGVNAAGVKFDMAIDKDGDEDPSWDGVWDVATRIDEKGWAAEYRIPLSQLRFPKSDNLTFGFSIWRDIARSNVRVSWPLWRRTQPGMVSQFGELSGISRLATPRRLEVTPYTVAKNLTDARADGSRGRSTSGTAGADLKYGLTSNLTVDATINPDFGQVEADPSELNLTAFETFFRERRPFFLEGAGIFRYDLSCNDDVCSGLFYSRRLGRAPQLGGLYGDAGTKQSTNIIAATKLTGRFANGVSVGILDAATERVSGPTNQTVEPQSNYFVGRLKQDYNKGQSGVGLMLTATNRQLDSWSRAYLRNGAYVLGVDGRHRFGPGNQLEVSANLALSEVTGSPEAIAATQRSAVHYYQRPDGGLGLDTTRTSLGGYTASVGLNKVGGGVARFYTGYKRTSAGFEINDAGFLSHADEQSYNNWVGLQYNKPTNWYRSARVNFNQWTAWNTGGLLTGLGGNINAHAQFKNQWFGHLGYNLNNVGTVYSDRAARGGPAVRSLFSRSLWAGVETDQRWRVKPGLFVNGNFRNASGSWSYNVNQSTDIRMSSQLQAGIGASYGRHLEANQWNGNFTAGAVTHYTFAALDQRTSSLTARVDYTASPTLSLQVYASPFITSGQYANWRELSNPRADRYEDRYKPYTTQGEPGGFNFKQFRSNTVVRWEYRPGSTLFLVWAQGRTQDGVDQGSFDVGRDSRNLFGERPDNTFLIKSSYWFNW